MIRGRQLFTNTLANWMGTGVATLASLILTPFLVHHLDAERFGVYQIGRQFILYLALFDLGIIGAVLRFCSQAIAAADHRRVNELANSALVLYLGIAGTGAALSFAAGHAAPAFFRVSPEHAAETRWLFWGLGVWWALTMLAYPARGIVTGHQRYGLLSLLTAGSWVLTVVLVVALFDLGRVGLGMVGLAFVAGAALQLLGMVAVATRIQPTLRWGMGHVTRGTVRLIYNFGMWNMLFTISGLFLWSTDGIVIGRLLGPEAVPLFAIPFMLIHYGRIVASGFTTQLTPIAAGQVGRDPAALQAVVIRGTRLGLILTLAGNGVLVVVAADLLRLWIGPEYASGWIVYAYLMASFWAVYAQRPIYQILLGAGDIRGPALAVLLATVLTLGLKIAALGWLGLGIEAVALLNLVFVLPVMAVYVPWCGCRLAGLSLARLYREAYALPLLAFVPVAAVGWLVQETLPAGGLVRFVTVFGALVLAYLSLAVFTLDADERAGVAAVLRRPLSLLRRERAQSGSP